MSAPPPFPKSEIHYARHARRRPPIHWGSAIFAAGSVAVPLVTLVVAGLKARQVFMDFGVRLPPLAQAAVFYASAHVASPWAPVVLLLDLVLVLAAGLVGGGLGATTSSQRNLRRTSVLLASALLALVLIALGHPLVNLYAAASSGKK